MSYFQSFHFSMFCFPEAFFFAKRCIAGVLRSGVPSLQFFLFTIFRSQEVFFSSFAVSPDFSALEFFISNFFFFLFLPPQSFFFAKRCISGVLRSGMSYFQSFHFSIFSFPEVFFAKR